MFKEKGEISGNVSATFSEESNKIVGVTVQGAYAISEEIAASFTVSTLKQLKSDDAFWAGQGVFYEIGAGTYGTFDNKMFTYEVFGGLGSGYVRNQNPDRANEILTTKIFKPYIQPSIGISTAIFEVAFTPRLAYASYNMTGYNSISGGNVIEQNKRGSMVIEPGMTLRAGFRGTKFQLQYNYSTFDSPEGITGLMKNTSLTFGLFFLLSQRGDNYTDPF